MPDNICFTEDPGRELTNFLATKKYSAVAVLTDENTRKHCYPLLENQIPAHTVITVPAGEEAKNLQTASSIWKALTDQKFDRHGVLIIVGGGVLGDMGGFCAVTYKRGIDFVLIPTTLLSQVDSSVGGKLGIDFENYKNHIGVFQTPALTAIHTGFLKSLPERELRSGFAEVLKHCIISDASMWNEIRRKSWKDQNWEKVIPHSVNFKLKIVAEDPRENGVRKILNTGHTIGHAVESYLLNHDRKVLHGEAVAAGLIMEAYLANQKGILTSHDADQIFKYVTEQFGKVDLPENGDAEILTLMLQDKKNKGNKILCVLLEGIGRARWDCEISNDEVKGALSFYRGY
jgi:3-dehydroquinate synthase